jgi:hypothetical protein
MKSKARGPTYGRAAAVERRDEVKPSARSELRKFDSIFEQQVLVSRTLAQKADALDAGGVRFGNGHPVFGKHGNRVPTSIVIRLYRLWEYTFWKRCPLSGKARSISAIRTDAACSQAPASSRNRFPSFRFVIFRCATPIIARYTASSRSGIRTPFMSRKVTAESTAVLLFPSMNACASAR